MFLFVIISCVIVALTIYHFKERRMKELGNKFPGPPGLPLLGNAKDFLKITAEEIFKKIITLSKEYGDLYRIWMGPDLWLVLSNPEDVEVILSSTKLIKKADDYDLMIPWLGTSLLISDGHKWFARRKAITPAFHFKVLEQFVDVLDVQSNILVTKWKGHENGELFNICDDVTLCALDVICETSMGTSVNAQMDANSPYCRAVRDLARVIYLRMFNAIDRINFVFQLKKASKIQADCIKIVHEFIDKVIKQRREELIKSIPDEIGKDQIDQDIGAKKKMAFLDILLKSTVDGVPLSDEDIREEVNTFMFAGHDTTTSAIIFLLYNLAKNTDVQNKLFEEIRQIFTDDKEKPITFRRLNDLNYMDLVIKESMRMHPPVPMFGRELPREIQLKDGRLIPKRTNISISVYLMHHDAKLFPDPESFIPERFDIVTNAEKTNPFGYIPFSAGPRNCIGQKFAILEIKSVVSKILRHFEIELADRTEELILQAELVLKPVNGINLKLKPRVYS